jgi:hypothetical protein
MPDTATDPTPTAPPRSDLNLASAARDLLRSDVSWRRLRRENGKIYKWALKNFGTVVREALRYPGGIEGDYEMPKYYGAAAGHPLEGLSISKETGMFWLPLEGQGEKTRRKQFLNGDLLYFVMFARKLGSREEAVGWLEALRERMESKEWRASENRRRFVERNLNWNRKDVVWEAIGKKEWYGDTGRLARLINTKFEPEPEKRIEAGGDTPGA